MLEIIIITFLSFIISIGKFLDGKAKGTVYLLAHSLVIFIFAKTLVASNYKLSLILLALFIACTFIFKPISAQLMAFIIRKKLKLSGHYLGLPNRKLAKLSRNISYCLSKLHSDKVQIRAKEMAKQTNALVEYVFNLEENKAVLRKNKIDKEKLYKIFGELLDNGANSWAGGHFIAASAISYSDALIYLHENKITPKTVADVTMYFKCGAKLNSSS